MPDWRDLPCKYVLFTNLQYVTVNDVRTNSHALLLDESPGIFDEIRRVARGFGVDPAWPVFDLRIPTLDYELTDAASNSIMLTTSHPEGRPLCSGAIMQIKGGPRLDLIVHDQDQPISIQTFEGRYGDEVISAAWEELSSLCAKFWKAPNMPRLAWGPTPGYRSR